MKDETTAVIFGKHAVIEALTYRPDVVRIVYVTDDTREEVGRRIGAHPILTKPLNLKKLLHTIPPEAVHQGFVAEIDTEKLMVNYEDFMRAHTVTNDSALVILGEVQDPHNVGAIIRSASAFGMAGVLIPEHRQAQVGGTIIKVSVGTAFRIPLVRIGNVNHTIDDLKTRGFWSYGLAMDASQSIVDEGFERPSVIVVGNEGDGVRQKTLAHCDIPLRIPIMKGIESLNASVATAIVCYAWSVRHPHRLS